MRTFGKLLLALLASLGFFTLIIFVGILYAVFQIQGTRTPSLPVTGKVVVSLDLDDAFVEGNSGPRLEGFNFRSVTSLQDVIIAIRRAKDDARVVALKATVSNQSMGLAQVQEVRDAVADFRTSGKKAYLFSETMGEGEGTLSTYYLAAAFGDIWVQPTGTVGVAGIGSDNFFLKKFLERFGVKASFLARGEYKSAPETLTNTAMSPANREETRAMIGGWFDQMLAGIAENRKLAVDVVKAMVDKGPLLADEALQGGLIDHLGYRDQFDDMLKKESSGATAITLARYLGLPRSPSIPTGSKRIAMIHAVGEIARGDDKDGQSLVGSTGVRSDEMVKAIRKAADDKKIDAILIRIDSPGGSAVASDTIWREIVKAKEKKKPIIVSMGDTAASGGYYIAMAADRIFAQPATVTGSIGVFTGKVIFGDALTKLDINHERVAFGDSAGTFSAITDFSPKDVERINRMLDATYADFTSKAAEGRGKTKEEIDKIARGRVWTGADALKVGLVDELGGFAKAIDYTKTKIGLKAEDPVILVPFPEPDQPWWLLFNAFENGDVPLSILAFTRISAWIERVAGPVFSELGAQMRGPQARMTPVTIN
jgi:protease-4